LKDGTVLNLRGEQVGSITAIATISAFSKGR
jgi:hypothetical protein